MKLDNSKNNFKELGKDLKAIAVGTFGVLVGLIKIPVAFCKDVRDTYLELKSKEGGVNGKAETVQS